MTDSIPRFRPFRTAALALAGAGLLVAACDAPTPSEGPTEPDAPASAAAGEASGDLHIRGIGSLAPGSADAPLVLVDGERIETEGVLDDLEPEDIASIEILKGPAALELYGDEARNGVIRVSTKAAAASGG